MNSRSSHKSDNKYSKEKFNDDKYMPHSHNQEAVGSRYESSSYGRRKFSPNKNKNSSRERDHVNNIDDRSSYSENRRVAYRTDDRNYDRHKFDKDRSHTLSRDHCDSYHRDKHRENYNREIHNRDNHREIHNRDNHRGRSVEREYNNDKKPAHKNHRSLEDVDAKLAHNDRRSRSPKTDHAHFNHYDSRTFHPSDNRHERSSNINNYSKFSHRNPIDHHNSNVVKHHSAESYDANYHYSETYSHDFSHKNDYDKSHAHDSDYQASIERHISLKNSSAAEHEEFVASLLQKIVFLNNQITCLTQENEKLKLSKNEEPAAEISIKFGNKRFEEKFLPILKDLATDLITGRCSIEALSSFLEQNDASLLQSENWNVEGELFSLDNSCEEPKESASVPRYDKGFDEVLQNSELLDDKETDDKSRESKPFARTCFNCDGDHLISECTLPRNRRKIAIARSKNQSTFVSNKRYHVCENQYSKFKPGIISEELREALDLEKNQIPPYIYRMRILDYPPGWQAEAVVESSGIALYDSEDTTQSDEKGRRASTECPVQYDPHKLIDFPGFNVPAAPEFIDESDALGYPQFQSSQLRTNVEKTLRKLERPSRKRKIDLPQPKGAKTVRLDENMDIDEDLDPTIIAIKEFHPPLPEEKLPPPPPEDSLPPPPSSEMDSPAFSPFSSTSSPTSPKDGNEGQALETPDSDFQSGTNSPMLNPDSLEFRTMMEPLLMLKEDSHQSSGDGSPSLRELEEMKKRLVKELGITTEPSSPAVPVGSASNDDDTESLKTVVSEHYGSLENANEFSNLSDSSFSSKASNSENSASNKAALQRTESMGSKLISLGTPSISRHSSYTKLPNYENFSKDVTSHINFENLPNATGTYQRMKKVIKKVKAKINSMMQ